ncbi:MAG: hypothetical protein OEY51_01430 [Cyclobacteriaceae bacterium]|nr:hypothetical protein [Cyclobacteriaceae bacterium]
MEDNKNQSIASDEIDLREVFKAIGQFFLNLWNGLVRLIIRFRRTTINHYKLITVITVISVLFGTGQYYRIKPYYKSTMLLQSAFLNHKLLENTIENLNQLTNTEEHKGLEEVLRVSPDVARNILRFEVEPFVTDEEIIEMEKLKMQLENAKVSQEITDPILAQLTLSNKRAFELSVYVYEPELIGDLDMLLFDYIKSNAYVSKQLTAHEDELKARLAKLRQEQPKLDSLKTFLLSHLKTLSSVRREGSDNVIIGEEQITDPLTVFQRDISLNDDILRIEKQLYLKADFELIDRFTPYYEPESASLKKMLWFHFELGIAIAYLLIAVMGINRWLSSMEKQTDL